MEWKRVMLISMTSTVSSLSTSFPSTEPNKEQKEVIAVMIAPQEKPIMPKSIKGAIDEQGQGNADLMENSEQTQNDQDSVNQEPQKVEEEQWQTNIEDSDRVSKKIEHLADLIVMPLPENLIISSKIKSIVPVDTHEDQVVEAPRLSTMDS